MRLLAAIFCALAASVPVSEAGAQALIGLAAPLSGPSAILGQQMRTGANLAAERLGDPSVRLAVADDGCTAQGGARAARELIAAQVQVVVGFLCSEALEAALPILKQANIPTITVGVRTDSITDRRNRTGWLVYRLGPRADGEREAAGRLLAKNWQRDLFAIVDDGTIYGRELAESVRIAAEQARLSPVFVDTFRPQLDNQIALVGRLQRAGATRAFVGGERDDVAVIARDAAQPEANIIVASGETLRSTGEVPLVPGTLMVALPEWVDLALPEVAKAFADRRLLAQGYVLPAYAAVEVAHAAIAGQLLPSGLSGSDFATAIGTIRFDENGDLGENPYRLFRFDGTRFTEVAVP
ncbi:MAG: branched-chain amino acid ABC transporter substrate-binding protein [Mesorhizobium sp.]|nr:branched-chain amino acid ABC transporter substrate-binding protein [Mesorhizobium sp.]MBL8576095.1 branched-chain amino acid ABC transporter substrate-binding protein [Mesorhizobium sp.]